MNRIEINVTTGKRKVIELTAKEITQAETQYAEWEAEQAKIEAAKQAVVDAKQSALNKLMALGLTEEEALALGVK